MRKGVKIGIWSLVGILTVSGGMALVSTLYFNSKNSSNNSNNQKPNDSNTNKPNNGNNNPTTPPSNDNNNNNDNSNPDNNGNVDKPNKPENPAPTPPKPEEPKPPTNPDKPTNPNKPINPPSNGDNNNNNDTTGQTIQTKFKLDEVFDKYNYIKKTTNYQDYFRNNKLTFDSSKVKIVTYDIFKPMIIKAMNIDLTKNTLKINIYYRLNQDGTELKLQVKWGLISNNSLISLEKKYYDNIYIKLR